MAPGPAPAECPRRPGGAPSSRLDRATLLRRTFAIDVPTCARCGDRRVVLALVTAPKGVRAILAHLDLPATPLSPPPQRAPPDLWLDLP